MTDEDRIEVLEAALWRIAEWARAYPLEVWPEPDGLYLAEAHAVLAAHGMGIDRISASAMRHVIVQVRKIAEGALGRPWMDAYVPETEREPS